MAETKTVIFAGGCFWCTEAVYAEFRGVVKVEPGYTGGTVPSPTYEQVSTGTTGHAEAARITYDSSQISYDDLLDVFFATHDPTTLNRQGNDVGTQYRSAIFYGSDEERAAAERKIAAVQAGLPAEKQVVTALESAGEFYPAEPEHLEYYVKHRSAPYCMLVIDPKVEKLRKEFADKLQNGANAFQ